MTPTPLLFIETTEKLIHLSVQLFDLRIACLLALWTLTLMNLLLAHLRTHLTLKQ